MNPPTLTWLGALGFLLGLTVLGSAWLLVLSAMVILTGVIWGVLSFVFPSLRSYK